MKEALIYILEKILKKLSQATIGRYRPGIIGVTGSAGKTSTKLAIASVLGSERRIRVSQGNFNNKLGFPLTVLGNYNRISFPLIFWPRVIAAGFFRLIFKASYPEILILEYAIDRPGDMKYLLEIAKPNIGIITALSEIPPHVEFFESPEELFREKARLIESLSSGGFAILNSDDDLVMSLKDRTRAHIMTFGFGENAQVKISSFENYLKDGEGGITFKLASGGSFVPVKIDNVFGKAQSYAAAAAAAVGLIFGMNLVKISEALKNYKPLAGRGNLVLGEKDSLIIDDSYNANLLSMENALKTLKNLPAKRKIAVLGDMLEIDKYTLEAHERIGRLVQGVVDILVTVGPRAKFIAAEAQNKGLNKKNIYSFEDTDEAKLKIQEIIKKGDLILFKASRAIHLEKIIEEIKA